MSYSPIGSWLLSSSFDWRIQGSAEGFPQAARVAPTGGTTPGAAFESPSTDGRIWQSNDEISSQLSNPWKNQPHLAKEFNIYSNTKLSNQFLLKQIT